MCSGPLIISDHERLNNEVTKLTLENLFAVNLPVIFLFLYFIAFITIIIALIILL